MSASKSIILITGANSGIGKELARQLLADPSKHVLLGARSASKGEAAVKELQALKLPGTIELLLIDVTDQKSVDEAAAQVESRHGRLDALVNNAANNGMGDPSYGKRLTDAFLANATGPAIVGDAFEPLLKKSIFTPRIINISSLSGSIEYRLDRTSWFYKDTSAIAYRVSKAALNMVSADQSVRYQDAGIKVFAYCPGFTISNLTENNIALNGARPTDEAVTPMLKVLNGERDAENGRFLHDKGQHPW
ncbi:Short chain dehydrogenase-like protein 40 [Elsinoe fawcettii]|nr:Short chain dehydrogenase-like protein 40 [Elsinoe fawcettii]